MISAQAPTLASGSAGSSQTLPGSAESPVLAPSPAAAPLSYLCGGQIKVEVPASVYAAVQASASCVATDEERLCLVTGYSVDFDLYAAIKAGGCVQVTYTSKALLGVIKLFSFNLTA